MTKPSISPKQEAELAVALQELKEVGEKFRQTLKEGDLLIDRHKQTSSYQKQAKS